MSIEQELEKAYKEISAESHVVALKHIYALGAASVGKVVTKVEVVAEKVIELVEEAIDHVTGDANEAAED